MFHCHNVARCNHHWIHFSTTGSPDTLVLGELCSFCGERRERPAGPTEKEVYAIHHNQSPEEDVHLVWHRFQRAIIDRKTRQIDPEKIRNIHIPWWQRKYPGYFYTSRMDDSAFMGSDILLIAHKCKTSWFGVTAFFMTQDGQPVFECFFYPHHVTELANLLCAFQKDSHDLWKIEKQKQRQQQEKQRLATEKDQKYIRQLETDPEFFKVEMQRIEDIWDQRRKKLSEEHDE